MLHVYMYATKGCFKLSFSVKIYNPYLIYQNRWIEDCDNLPTGSAILKFQEINFNVSDFDFLVNCVFCAAAF